MKSFLKLLPLTMVTTLVACQSQGTTYKIPSTAKVLVVDLHTYMPTGSSSSADLVSVTATKTIAENFEKATGIQIKWFSGKSLDGETEAVSGDYIKAIQNGTMPAIGFSWSAFKDRGYYLNLDEYLDTPNEFLSEEDRAKYPKWRDQFPSYLFQTKEVVNENGKAIAVPIVLNPGPATGWFYNKTAFEANGYDVPTTWQQFKTLAQEVGSNSAGPFVYNQSAKITNWEFKFSIGPAFANVLTEINDLNKDGVVDDNETLEGVLAKRFSPLQSENPEYYQVAQGCLQVLKDFYKNVLPDNWKTVDAEAAWANGTALLRQNGLWALRAENGLNNQRSWKYGAFAAPIVSSDSANFLNNKGLDKAAGMLKTVKTLQVEQKDDYTMAQLGDAFINLQKPTAALYVNLMKHGIYEDKTVLENAVKFLKFLSLPENVTLIAQDHQGVLGASKGSVPGRTLKDWLLQAFPENPTCFWPDAYVVANNGNINQALNKWVSGSQMSDDEFYELFAREQFTGASEYKKALNSEE